VVDDRPSASHCREQVRRIVASDHLRHSPSLIQLFEYLAEQSLAGRAHELKEYVVGVEALGKPEGYDPQHDGSVRSQVRRLRAKLALYYEHGGHSDSIHMTLPKGGFEVCFEAARPEVSEARAAALEASLRGARLAAAGCALGALLFATLWLQPFGSPQSAETAAPLPPEVRSLWAPYLDSARPTVISLGIPLFVGFDLPADGDQGPASATLRDPGWNRWGSVHGDERMKLWKDVTGADHMYPRTNYMAVGEAIGAFTLGKTLLRGGLDAAIVRSPSLSRDAISASNMIYLGAPNLNPQLRIDDFGRHFRLTERGNAILNLSPEEGEAERYAASQDGEERIVPAIVGRYRNRDGNGVTTVIGSPANLAVWGAVDYLTSPRYATGLRDALVEKYAVMPESFEAVLVSRLVEDHPVEVTPAAVRAIAPDSVARSRSPEQARPD